MNAWTLASRMSVSIQRVWCETDGCGEDDVDVLQLQVVVHLRVAGQLHALQADRWELLLPVVMPLAAQRLHWSHWGSRRDQSSIGWRQGVSE